MYAAGASGNRVAQRPRCRGHRLQGVVDGAPPQVRGRRRAWHHQGPTRWPAVREPLGGLPPPTRLGGDPRLGRQLTGQGRCHRYQPDPGHREDGERADGERDAATAQRPLRGDPAAGQQVPEAHRQRQPHQRVELVDVAEGDQDAVEEPLGQPARRRSDRRDVAERHRDQPDGQQGQQERPVPQVAPRQPGQAGGGHRDRGQDDQRSGRQDPAGRPGGRAEIGDPLVGTAQGGLQGGRHRRRRRRLDPVEERRAVAPELDQRHQPPGAGQRRRPAPTSRRAGVSADPTGGSAATGSGPGRSPGSRRR